MIKSCSLLEDDKSYEKGEKKPEHENMYWECWRQGDGIYNMK